MSVAKNRKGVVGGLGVRPHGQRLVRGGAVGRRGGSRAAREPGQQEGDSCSSRNRRRRSRARANRPARPTAARTTRTRRTTRTKPREPAVYPYTCLVEPGGKRCFVSLWARAGVAVIDLEKNAVVATWPTAEHPTEMLLSPKGDALYVACANSTKVSVIDPATGKGIQTINCALYPNAPNGNTPNSLAMTPDGQMLFVANADANNLSVFNIADRTKAMPLGFIPTGWYPTSVRYNADRQAALHRQRQGHVVEGQSRRAEPAAARGAQPERVHRPVAQGHADASMRLPTPEQMAEYTQDRVRVQPATAKAVPCAPRTSKPTTPSRRRSATPARSSTASTS